MPRQNRNAGGYVRKKNGTAARVFSESARSISRPRDMFSITRLSQIKECPDVVRVIAH
jgi:hypothetical protein